MRSSSAEGRQDRLLFGALFLLFLTVASGRLVSTDESAITQVALALATFHVRFLPVTKYAIGMSLLEAPFLWAGEWIARLGGVRGEIGGMAALTLLPAAAGAGVAVLTARLARALGQSPRQAGLAAIGAAVASPLFVYATRFFTELPQAAAVTSAVLFALGGNVVASGFSLGALLLLKPASAAITVPFVFLYLWMDPADRRSVLRLAAPVLVALVIVLLHNEARFGGPLELGYDEPRDQEYAFHGSLWTGLYGLTLSSGAGLLVFMPLCVPAVVGLVRLGHRLPRSRILLWGLPLAYLVFHAKWWSWHGGWCWGPRFLVPVIPLIAIGLGELQPWVWSRARRVTFASAIVISVALQLPGVAVSSGDYASTIFHACNEHFPMWSAEKNAPVDDQTNLHYIPEFTPPLGHTWIAVTRLFGQRYPAPWEEERLCPRIRIPDEPLEWWWARAAAGGGLARVIAPLTAAILLLTAVLLLSRWHRLLRTT